MECSYISDTKEFFNLKDEWNGLLEKSNSNTIFLRWEWLFHWWATYGNVKSKLLIISVRDEGKLVGIAPLYKYQKYHYTVSEVKFLGSNIVCSDYLDFILLKGKEKTILEMMISSIKSDRHSWDIFNLTDIPEKSHSIKVLEKYFLKYHSRINKRYTICPYINLTTLQANNYSSYDSVIKNTITRKKKKLKKIECAQFIEANLDQDFNMYYSRFVKMNKLRLNSKKIHSPFMDSHFYNYHKNVLKELYKKKMVKMIFLKVKEDLIAGLYVLTYNNKYYFYQSGIDPKWLKLSPGTLLFDHTINDACKEGYEEFDFLQGDERYKQNWTKTYRHNISMVIYNITNMGKIIYMVDKIKKQIKQKIKCVKTNNYNEKCVTVPRRSSVQY